MNVSMLYTLTKVSISTGGGGGGGGGVVYAGESVYTYIILQFGYLQRLTFSLGE